MSVCDKLFENFKEFNAKLIDIDNNKSMKVIATKSRTYEYNWINTLDMFVNKQQISCTDTLKCAYLMKDINGLTHNVELLKEKKQSMQYTINEGKLSEIKFHNPFTCTQTVNGKVIKNYFWLKSFNMLLF